MSLRSRAKGISVVLGIALISSLIVFYLRRDRGISLRVPPIAARTHIDLTSAVPRLLRLIDSTSETSAIAIADMMAAIDDAAIDVDSIRRIERYVSRDAQLLLFIDGKNVVEFSYYNFVDSQTSLESFARSLVVGDEIRLGGIDAGQLSFLCWERRRNGGNQVLLWFNEMDNNGGVRTLRVTVTGRRIHRVSFD